MPTHLQAKHTPAPTAAPAAAQFSARGFEEETEQVEEQVPEVKELAGGADTPPSEPSSPPPADGGSAPPSGDGTNPNSNFSFLDMPLRAEEAGVQAKLTIGEPGDKYEREADQTAAQVMRMPDPQGADPLETGAGATAVQQQCSTCEAEQSKKPSIQRKERGEAEPTAALQSRLNQQTGKGSPLPDGVRSHLEPRFGNDFSGVRVHTDSAAVQMNRELGAQAFTHGNDIYFNRGKYSPGSRSGQELLAHELTHTVQQTGGVQFKPEESQAQAETPEIQQKTKGSHFLWRMVQTKMGMLSPKEETGSPEVQAKCSQCEGEDTIQRQPISSMDSGDETVQAYSWDDFTGDARTVAGAVGSGVQAGAEFVGEGLGNLADFSVDSFAALVEKFSPELADLIRQGPLELLKETVGEGIKDWFNGLLEELGIADIVEDFRGSFDSLFETVRLVMEGDPETCDAVAEKLNSMTEFVSGVMDNPKVKALQDAFTQAGETFQEILDVFVAPVFNTIMDVVGDALSGIVDFGRQIWEWGAPVRNALKEAWDWVLEQLGIGGDGDSEGGLINWIKDKASEAWESVKETLDPVIEPIRNVVMVAAALSPITWIAAAVKYAPQIIEMVQWLWANRNNPNIVESAHEEMGHTILPQLLSGLQGFGDGLESVVNSIIGEVTKISDGLISLISSLTGLPLLSMIKGTMETISTGIKDFVTWSRETFQSISKSAVAFAKKIQTKLKPYIEVLTSLGAAIINPAMIPNILLGWAWRKLPDCYKGPIIDFLLDTLIEILSGMPDFPFFGVLWPFLKQGVLGFLRGLRAQATEVKVAISNKIAKIISGSSPAFALGFVKGFVRGIWEGLTDPFMLIYEAVTGINDVKDWLNRSDTEGGSQSGTQADSTANQPSDTVRQPGATTQNTEARGGRGGSGVLQQAGLNTLAIVIDRLLSMASELDAPSNEVTTNFLSAVTEVFSGAGEDITFEDVMAMMGDVQGQVMTAIGEAGGQIANQVCEFMMQDAAEAKIGDGAGWLAGTIVLELVLAYFTAGASIVAKGAIKAGRMITKVLDRSGPMMRMAADGMKTMGRHLDEILASVRKLLSKAGDKASKVMDSLGFIGRILRRYGDDILVILMGGMPTPGGRRPRGSRNQAANDNSASRQHRENTPDAETPSPTGRNRNNENESATPPGTNRPPVGRDRTPDGESIPNTSPQNSDPKGRRRREDEPTVSLRNIDERFTTEAGERHRLFFLGGGRATKLKIRSIPILISQFLTQKERENNASTNRCEEDKKEIKKHIEKSRNLIRQIENITYRSNPHGSIAVSLGRRVDRLLTVLAGRLRKIDPHEVPAPPLVVVPGFSSSQARGLEVKYLKKGNHRPGTPARRYSGNLNGALDTLEAQSLRHKWVAFHLLNEKTGGLAVDSNLIPTPDYINNLYYKNFEVDWRNNYTKGKVLWMKVLLDYHDTQFVKKIFVEGGIMEIDHNSWKPDLKKTKKFTKLIPLPNRDQKLKINRISHLSEKQIRLIARLVPMSKSLIMDIKKERIDQGNFVSDKKELKLFVDAKRGQKGYKGHMVSIHKRHIDATEIDFSRPTSILP